MKALRTYQAAVYATKASFLVSCNAALNSLVSECSAAIRLMLYVRVTLIHNHKQIQVKIQNASYTKISYELQNLSNVTKITGL